MKIKPLGAVGTVTGSSFQLEMDDGELWLLDCGMFQGGVQMEMRNSDSRPYQPLALRGIVITHAHMDHSGLVPRLVRDGYRGPVFATEATADLLEILWLDAANIQKHEAIWKTRKNSRQDQKPVEPLFDENDARMAMTLLRPTPFNQPLELRPGLVMQYIPAGHILGAASVHFTAAEGPTARRVVFSGDLGRTEQLIMPQPVTPPEADAVFMETTYGNRLHKDLNDSVEELYRAVLLGWEARGKILIPAFAVERTQEILLLLAKGKAENRIPRELPVILDSPLASAATEIYKKHTGLFDLETHQLMAQGVSPLDMPELTITKGPEESQKLNELAGPAIIMAGSGMANAGRILHHLKHNLWRPECQVIFVGFQAQGTTGRQLVEQSLATRPRPVKIFREPIQVKARVHTIGGFSGHADQKELIEWLRPQTRPGLTVNLIHGELNGTKEFMELAKKTFPEVSFNIPERLHYAALAPAETSAAIHVDPQFNDQAVLNLRQRISLLDQVADRAGAMRPEEVAQAENLLAQVQALLAGANGNGSNGANAAAAK